MQKILQQYLLIIAMVIGITLYKPLSHLFAIIPYSLAVMLFITYTRISWMDIHLSKFHYLLLSIQYIGSIAVYLLLLPVNRILAQAALMCILAPTATSAPVVAGILGGSISTVASYSIISNLSTAFITPFILTFIGNTNETAPFFPTFWYIFQRVMPVLILPFAAAITLKKISPKAHEKIRSAQIVSFYLWGITLTIVIANVTRFVVAQGSDNYLLEILIGISALIICLLQFFTGRKIGFKFDKTIAGGQGLGQKNTVLAIWMTQAYLNPIASLGPGLYALWQNLVNSYQIWKKQKEE
ncbi:MAG TPA: transporter [Porphyromonadaceae bacterium]|nr:transporter [Porphyromonadaceae bacterium]HCM19487.1 transporter [Porphyromonadaceae bacterium]